MIKQSALILAAASTIAGASVWENTNQWDLASEMKYARFVKSAPQDLFRKLGVEVRQVSLPYLYRAYFAAQNGLPFVTKIKGRNKFVSNLTSDFDVDVNGLEYSAEDKLVMFLQAVTNVVNTGSLLSESFPVNLEEESLLSGSVYVNGAQRVFVVKDGLGEDFKFERSPFFPSSKVVTDTVIVTPRLDYTPNPSKQDGFKAFKWPNPELNGFMDHYALSSAGMDYRYGLGQYDRELTPFSFEENVTFGDILNVKFKVFTDEIEQEIQKSFFSTRKELAELNKKSLIYDALELPTMKALTETRIDEATRTLLSRNSSMLPVETLLKAEVTALCDHFKMRKAIVDAAERVKEEGLEFNPEFTFERRSKLYNRYSTPTRDKKIFTGHWRNKVKGKFGPKSSFGALKKAFQACTLEYTPGFEVSLYDFLLNYGANRRAMGNPNSNVHARWGLPHNAPVVEVESAEVE